MGQEKPPRQQTQAKGGATQALLKINNPEANERLGFSPVSPHLRVGFINTRLSNGGRSVCVYPRLKRLLKPGPDPLLPDSSLTREMWARSIKVLLLGHLFFGSCLELCHYRAAYFFAELPAQQVGRAEMDASVQAAHAGLV